MSRILPSAGETLGTDFEYHSSSIRSILAVLFDSELASPLPGRPPALAGSLSFVTTRHGGEANDASTDWLGTGGLLLAGPASAQQGTTELRGKVIDAQGAILPGVTLTVTNQDSGMFRTTTSGPDGTFIASGLVPGTYKLVASLQGFKKVERKDLRLEVGKTVSIDVTMTLGSFEETVSVTATSPLVDITSKEIGGNITSETLVQLPSVNGNFIGFVGLLPGIVPSISTESFGSDSVSVNGQDPRNNNYMLDGGNNNDDVIGQRAGMQARTPIEAVQEFQVISGQYRRGVRPHLRRHHQRGDQAGDKRVPRQRVRLLPGRQPDDE